MSRHDKARFDINKVMAVIKGKGNKKNK